MKTKLFLLACLSIALYSCTKNEAPVTGQNSSSEFQTPQFAKQKPKSIRGTLNYKATNSFDLDCSDCQSPYFNGGNYFGQGELSHLGKISSKTEVCIGLIFDENGQIIGVHVENQCSSFITPDKELIYLSNQPYDLYINPVTGKAEGEVYYDFAGGTGKFAQSQGTVLAKVVNDLQGNFTAVIEGNLYY